MAAPTVTARSTPAGIPLTEGYQILFAFERDPDISIWEKTVKLPSIDMGDPIDISSQHSVEWIPMVSAALATLGEITISGSFDPNAYNQLIAMKGINQSCTLHLPDGSTIAFWGYLKKVEGPEGKKKEQPDLSITVQPSNYDPENHVVAGPVITSVSGT
jgi:hypothetical protein